MAAQGDHGRGHISGLIGLSERIDSGALRHAKQRGGLVLVGDEKAEAAQDCQRNRLGGRGVEDGRNVVLFSDIQRGFHGFQRALQLHQQHIAGGEGFLGVQHILTGQIAGSTGKNGDLVVAGGVGEDGGKGGGLLAPLDHRAYAFLAQTIQTLTAEVVAAQTGQIQHFRAQTTGSHSLIVALSAGLHEQSVSAEGFAGLVEMIHFKKCRLTRQTDDTKLHRFLHCVIPPCTDPADARAAGSVESDACSFHGRLRRCRR